MISPTLMVQDTNRVIVQKHLYRYGQSNSVFGKKQIQGFWKRSDMPSLSGKNEKQAVISCAKALGLNLLKTASHKRKAPDRVQKTHDIFAKYRVLDISQLSRINYIPTRFLFSFSVKN